MAGAGYSWAASAERKALNPTEQFASKFVFLLLYSRLFGGLGWFMVCSRISAGAQQLSAASSMWSPAACGGEQSTGLWKGKKNPGNLGPVFRFKCEPPGLCPALLLYPSRRQSQSCKIPAVPEVWHKLLSIPVLLGMKAPGWPSPVVRNLPLGMTVQTFSRLFPSCFTSCFSSKSSRSNFYSPVLSFHSSQVFSFDCCLILCSPAKPPTKSNM